MFSRPILNVCVYVGLAHLICVCARASVRVCMQPLGNDRIPKYQLTFNPYLTCMWIVSAHMSGSNIYK